MLMKKKKKQLVFPERTHEATFTVEGSDDESNLAGISLGGGFDVSRAMLTGNEEEDDDEVVVLDNDDEDERSNGKSVSFLNLEDEEDDDPRYRISKAVDELEFARAGPHSEKVLSESRSVFSLRGKGSSASATANDDDEEEDEESVDFLGIDDGAEEVIGLANLPSNPGQAIHPEIENRVNQMAKVLQEYKSKHEKLKKQHKILIKANETLKQDLDRLEDEKEEAELKAERELRMIQYKSMGGGAGPSGGGLAADLEAQRKREEARRQMYGGADQNEEAEMNLLLDDGAVNLGFIGRRVRSFNSWVRRNFPLNRDLKRIEARYGTSIAAYFHFYRWMITNYMTISLVCFVFLVRHIYALITFQSLDDATKASRFNSANEPVQYFDWSSSDWGRVSSFLPKFLLISSFNPGDSGTIYVDTNIAATTPMYSSDGQMTMGSPYISDAEMGERMDYILMIVSCNMLLIASSARKWIMEDRKAKSFGLFEDLDKQTKFAQMSLNVWDHSLKDLREVEDLKHSLLDQYFLSVHELDTAHLKESRTLKERLKLYARRTISNLLYLAIQGSSAVAIVYLTATSTQMSQTVLQAVGENDSLSWLLPVVTLIAGSIVPIAVSIINAMLPTVAAFLTDFEKWDDGGFHTKLMLFRLFVAKILNALIQIFSFVQLMDPYFLRGTAIISISVDRTTRMNTEKRFVSAGSNYDASGVLPNGNNECRGDLYGEGIFQLVLTEFIISKMAFFLVPAFQYFIAKVRKKSFERGEFFVAKHMVDLLFFQQLCFMSFPYFPFGTLIVLAMMFVGFKVQMHTLGAFMTKPLKPWSAKDAANFFIKFFFFTYSVGAFVTWYILSADFLPKACTLQEHVTRVKYNETNPLSQCFNFNDGSEDICFLSDRTVADIVAGNDRAPGLEELRFWEEYMVAVSPEGTYLDNQTIPTEFLLRSALGYNDTTAVSFPSLLVCSLSCGPFIYNINQYAALDAYLSVKLKTLYTLTTQNALFVWSLTLLLILKFLFAKNTIFVLFELQEEKELALRNIVANFEMKIRKLTNKLEKLKQQ